MSSEDVSSEINMESITLTDASKSGVPAPKAFTRRDHLRDTEKRIQQRWKENEAFQANPAYDESANPKPKYMITFPYPYMNGKLHLGHGFSLTKAEFTARYKKLRGYNVLFPFGFHCTGMPIQAAANKLKDELTKYGTPPVFPIVEEEKVTEEKSIESIVASKSKGKKSKLVAKGIAGAPVRQWNILSMMVDMEDIPSFVHPDKWLEYFSPIGVSDLQMFGCAIDWRRSFITTAANLYYDKFVRWQFKHLQDGGRIKFGKRANIYSCVDGQVCLDHERASGEGVAPQEYTIIKLEVVSVPERSSLHAMFLEHPGKIFLAPATLRPETMYGQTNCFVLPEGEYGLFELENGDILVMSDRAAKGLAHQGYMKEWGVYSSMLDVTGNDLLGVGLKAPNAQFEVVYTLPLVTISMTKGTGVVTSVPSDAPDDYAALRELQEKPLWREKFGLTAEMVDPFTPVPIIYIDGYGDMAAVTMCERLGIKSCKDTDKLKIAKEEVYLKGFNDGVMTIGACAGMKVCDAKPILKQALIDSGDALIYFEPESLVVGRSGDACIVAKTDQWLLAYGEQDWKEKISGHIHSSNFNSYNEKIMEQFDFVVGWLKEWACCRLFGLGTRLPWDEQFVIESLSDSTIYMAYYTIAHYFQSGINNISNDASKYGIKPEDLTMEVFDFIFLRKAYPSECNIPETLLTKMRNEFEYWYPMDLRVSAKDLIPNHLTMCLYNHAEIWKDRPEMWPRGIYCNGHVMVDAEKMGKSKGNFLLMDECVALYSADATRLALADAGDSLEDANFDRLLANQSVTSLFVEEEFVKSVVAENVKGALRTGDMTFMDRVFFNEVSYLIEGTTKKFDAMYYREGIHKCWFELTIARDMYRDWSSRCSIPMHAGVIMFYIESLVVMMSPICPHWSENLWCDVMQKPGSVCDTTWPVPNPVDMLLRKQYVFFVEFVKNFRMALIKTKDTKKRQANVYLAKTYEGKKVEMLNFLQTQFDSNCICNPDCMSNMKAFVASSDTLKVDSKNLLQFGAYMKAEVDSLGLDALQVEMPFDQKAIIEDNLDYVIKSLELTSVSLAYNTDDISSMDAKKRDMAIPGKPSYSFHA